MPSRRPMDATTSPGSRHTSTAHTSSTSSRRHKGRVRHVRGSLKAQVFDVVRAENVSRIWGNRADALAEYSHPGASHGGKSQDRPNAVKMASLQATRDLLSQC